MFPFAVLILEVRAWGRFFRKEQNIWKFTQRCTKFENILKNGGWLYAITARIGPFLSIFTDQEYSISWMKSFSNCRETLFNRNLNIMIFENHARSALVKYSIVLLIKDMGLDDTWT